MNSQLYHPATLLQYAVILAAIYVFLNGPFSGVSQGQSSSDESYDIPLSQEKADQLVYPDTGLQCDTHPYNVHIFSRSPLVIYIPNFISKVESKHMIEIRYIKHIFS
jgi:prolyl 4-hydroxylase